MAASLLLRLLPDRSAYLGLTLPLMPVQAVLSARQRRCARRLPRLLSPAGAAASSAFELERRGTPSPHPPDAVRRQPHLLSRHRDPRRARSTASFVAKAEVARWPLFGWLARLQRTVFVDRATAQHRSASATRSRSGSRHGDNLILFPEGTSGDGIHVLPFKSALFGAPSRRPARAAGGAAGLGRLYPARRHSARAGSTARSSPGMATWTMAPHLWTMLGLGPVDGGRRLSPAGDVRAISARARRWPSIAGAWSPAGSSAALAGRPPSRTRRRTRRSSRRCRRGARRMRRSAPLRRSSTSRPMAAR